MQTGNKDFMTEDERQQVEQEEESKRIKSQSDFHKT